jgi:hypothetical protein
MFVMLETIPFKISIEVVVSSIDRAPRNGNDDVCNVAYTVVRNI